jgi:hypothetical protein
MLFWLTLGLTIITFVIFGVFCSKHETWKKRHDKADAQLDYYPQSVLPPETRVSLRQERAAAYEKYHKYETIAEGFCAAFVVLLIILIIMLIALPISYACDVSTDNELKEEYNTLVYQVDHLYFTNEIGDTIGSKEVMDAVAAYNARIRTKQHWEKNFWVGIFVPNIYSDKPLIELP